MRVDFKKAQEIEFEVFLARPNKKTNLIQPQNFPSIREAKFIEIKTVYGKERFILSGFKDVMRQATEMCKSFIPYLEEEVESQDMKTWKHEDGRNHFIYHIFFMHAFISLWI